MREEEERGRGYEGGRGMGERMDGWMDDCALRGNGGEWFPRTQA